MPVSAGALKMPTACVHAQSQWEDLVAQYLLSVTVK